MLPDWVKEGLVPPKRKPSPPAAVLTENLAKPADLHACKDAVQISSNVRADLGFLVDFLPPTAAQVAAGGAVGSYSWCELRVCGAWALCGYCCWRATYIPWLASCSFCRGGPQVVHTTIDDRIVADWACQRSETVFFKLPAVCGGCLAFCAGLPISRAEQGVNSIARYSS